MRTAKLTVETSCHNMACIQAHDLSEEQARAIEGIVKNNFMASIDYKLGKPASPFLQSYQLDGEESWVLVEFWSKDTKAIQTFVDHVNSCLHLGECGDKVVVADGQAVMCTLEKDHPVVGFNNGKTRKYQFHEGEGWVWDERCAWRKGQEPKW